MEWQSAGRRKRGSLTEQLFDLAVNTGSSKFLDWARKAKDGKLGEDKVAQAWAALRRKPAGDPGVRQSQGRSGTSAAERRAQAAEKKANALEARLAKLESSAAPSEVPAPSGTKAAPVAAKERGAPEDTAADAEARAAELQASAARLRALGLTDAAEVLEKQVSAQRKIAESMPAPGKRIDMLVAWIERAEGRASAAAARIAEKENELAEARKQHEKLIQDLDEGRNRLARLRSEIQEKAVEVAQDATMHPSEMDELLQLRIQLRAFQDERLSAARAAETAGATAAAKQAQELRTQLASVQSEREAAVAEAAQALHAVQAAQAARADAASVRASLTKCEADATAEIQRLRAANARLEQSLRGQPSAADLPAGDVHSLQTEMAAAQDKLRIAYESEDVHIYEEALLHHAKIAAGLARALRIKPAR